ncbi:hypothetical protein ALQ66_05578 [Pseudomonas savastanoi pv. glycinea]|nr:hypothetical protein ALQ66_05578 [Pseudomonas savastanoi pv. glycinea]
MPGFDKGYQQLRVRLVFCSEMAGIFDLFGQFRVMQQGSQCGLHGRLDSGRYTRRSRFEVLALAFFAPGFVVPFFLILTAGFLWRPFLLWLITALRLVIGKVRHGVVIDIGVVARWCIHRRALYQLTDGLAGKPGNFGQALAHQNAQVRPRHFIDEWRREGGHVRLAFQRARVRLFGQLLEKIIGQRLGMLIDARLERVGAFGAHQSVRVFALGKKQKARPTPVLQVRQGGFQCPPRGIAPGLIAVEAEQHVGHDPEQAFQMLLAGRGTQRRHGIAQTLLRQGDDVHVAFNDDDFIEVAIEFAGFEQPVQLLALVENRCFRRVQVLGLVIAQYATAKGDDASARVAYRKHHPVTEAIIAFAGFGVLDQQTGIDHDLLLQ